MRDETIPVFSGANRKDGLAVLIVLTLINAGNCDFDDPPWPAGVCNYKIAPAPEHEDRQIARLCEANCVLNVDNGFCLDKEAGGSTDPEGC